MPDDGGASVATSTADDAACPISVGLPPKNAAASTAAATHSAICHTPTPVIEISVSPTRMPTATPTNSSTARRIRCPSETFSTITAAIGAKNGRGRPSRSLATSQASPAPSPAWPASSQVPRTRRSRSPRLTRDRCPSAASGCLLTLYRALIMYRA